VTHNGKGDTPSQLTPKRQKLILDGVGGGKKPPPPLKGGDS